MVPGASPEVSITTPGREPLNKWEILLHPALYQAKPTLTAVSDITGKVGKGDR
jgi:hypothetical protein